MPDKNQALEALKAANPKWSEKHIRYAFELMPTSNEVYYAEGTPEHARARAAWWRRWTIWAIEMNIVPDDTPVPQGADEPEGPNTRRRGSKLTNVPPTLGPLQPAKIPAVESNTVRAPKEGTMGKKIWDICDELTTKHGREAKVEEVTAMARERGLNEGNSRTEFSRWRKFHVK